MQFNLTLNKPAVTNFIDGTTKALKLKIVDGKLMIKPVASEGGRDTFPLSSRTRGGVGVTVNGRMAEAFLNDAGLQRGTHLTLEPTSYKWLAADVHGEPGEKPSKIIPTARLWRVRDEAGSMAADAPKKAPRASRATKTKAVAKKTTGARRGKSQAAQAAA